MKMQSHEASEFVELLETLIRNRINEKTDDERLSKIEADKAHTELFNFLVGDDR